MEFNTLKVKSKKNHENLQFAGRIGMDGWMD
jgi:hypothetical protein